MNQRRHPIATPKSIVTSHFSSHVAEIQRLDTPLCEGAKVINMSLSRRELEPRDGKKLKKEGC